MRRIVDRLLTILGWSPSWLKLPLVCVLAGSPAAWVLVQGRGLPAAPAQPGPQAQQAALIEAFAPESRPASADGDPAEGQPDRFGHVWEGMVRDLEAVARVYPGQVAVYVKDLKRGREWAYHADDLFPAASLIKVPVMCGVFDKISRGDLSLSSEVMLRRSTRMGGSGSLKWQRDGTRFPVRRLLEKLIDESDNTAQRMLIDEVGMGFLQRQFPKMGLVYTEIYPEGLNLTSGHVRYENYTTAREMGMLFEKIYKGEMVDKYSSQLMLEILKRRRPRSRLAKSLPVGWEIAHKTGLLRRACHDSSIIFSPDGDYVLTVLTGRNSSYSYAKSFITRVGKITYRHYRGDELYARAPEGSYARGHAR